MRLFEREPREPKRSPALRRSTLSLGDDFMLDAGSSDLNWPSDLLGVSPIEHPQSPESRLISDRPEMGGAIESFRLLGHRLRTIQKTSGVKRVLITSSVPGEGKTVVAANLGIILARSSARVLLVDADMRKPGSAGAFGVASLPGLADWLEDRLTLSEALHRVDDYNLWTIPAGRPERNPGELIQQPAMRQLLESAAEKFDWVIVDSPPLNPFIDAHLLAGMSDTTVLVLRSGTTPRDVYESSLKQLKGTTLAGVVLNGYEEPARSSYYSYYPTQSPAAGDKERSAL